MGKIVSTEGIKDVRPSRFCVLDGQDPDFTARLDELKQTLAPNERIVSLDSLKNGNVVVTIESNGPHYRKNNLLLG